MLNELENDKLKSCGDYLAELARSMVYTIN